MQHPVLWVMLRQARQARQAMMEPGPAKWAWCSRCLAAPTGRAKQGFPVWLAPRWLAGLGTNPRLGTACRSRAVTDPSRIVFGISPPPRTRGAPIARALIHDGFRWVCCSRHSRTRHLLAQARFAHLLLLITTPKTFSSPAPPGGLQEQLMVIDQHKEISRKKIGHIHCTSS